MAWTKQTVNVFGTVTPYWLFTPDSGTSQQYPLLVHLAGLGEVSNTGSDADFQRLFNNTPQELKDGVSQNNFVCIIPLLNQSIQGQFGQGWWPDYTDVFVSQGISLSYTDDTKVYIGGLSLGGGGAAWYVDSKPAYAAKIAACVDICGVCLNNTADYSQPAKNNVAVSAFHAADDPTVAPGCSFGFVQNVNSFNPKIPAIRTQYATGGHGIWGRVYNPNPTAANSVFDDGKLTTIYQWMLQYSKPAGSSTTTTTTTAVVPTELGRILVPNIGKFVVVYTDGSVTRQ